MHGVLRCHKYILGRSDYMSGVPFGVPSIGDASPRPTPRLHGDCEEQAEEDIRRPRRVSASVNLQGFYGEGIVRKVPLDLSNDFKYFPQTKPNPRLYANLPSSCISP